MSSATAFNLPLQDLAAPSQFAARPDALKHWLGSLPKTHLGQTSRALYQAVTELNRVQLAPSLRLQLLETLRPTVHFVGSGLRRHYLNQPIVLPEQAEKVSRLAHVLQQQLAAGYMLAALQGIGLGRQRGLPAAELATCLHRAISELSQKLLRDFSLYRDAQPGCWHRLHQLAQLAWRQGVEHQAVSDEDGASNIEAAYLRALLLGSAKTHQLRQADLPRVYRKLLGWSRSVSLCGPQQGLFAIDPGADSGPVYREFATPGPGWLGLDTRALASQLVEERAEVAAGEGSLSDAELSSDLLGHLVHTWSTASKRAFLRMESNEEVDIALGLAAAHHFIAGETHFNQLLTGSAPEQLARPDNPFLATGVPPRATERRLERRAPGADRRDIWDSIYSQRSNTTQVSLETIDYHIRSHQSSGDAERERERYRSHRVRTVNLSPGGFCLRWPPENATQIRTGEIVGLRENDSRAWSVGVVRWVRLQANGPQLGIELLAPTAAPYGARVINKQGAQGDWLRVLVLPELPQIGQPATLVTPRLPFREGQKAELQVRDRRTRIQLGRRIASSAAFSQFEFRRLGGAPGETDSKPSETVSSDGFDALWDSL